MARTPRLTRLLGMGLLSLLTASCDAWPTGNASPSRIESDGRHRWKRTELRGVVPGHQIGWLDDQRLLFIGYSKSQGKGLYVWDRQSPARLILPDAYRFCHDGKTWTALASRKALDKGRPEYIRYQLNPKNLSSLNLGSPTGEGTNDFGSEYTCKLKRKPQPLHNRKWIELRPEDGYLDLGAVDVTPQKASILKADGNSRTSLQLEATGESLSARHSRFLRGYIIYPSSFSPESLWRWRAEGKATVWLLGPGPKLEIKWLPQGPWTESGGGDRFIEPIKGGYAISSSVAPEKWKTTAGVYSIQADNSYTKLDSGSTQQLTASPNGCLLAYKKSHSQKQDSLQVIDLCKPERPPDETIRRSSS